MKNSLYDNGIDVFLKLFSLLYADDTIVLAESEKDLQVALNAVSDYCKMWLLTVNTNKTKIVIFSRGKVKKFQPFKFNDDIIDVVDDYVYLGTTFNYNNSFKKAQNKQVNQARRAMYSLRMKSRRLNLPVDLEIDLFDKLVIPILLYGSEVWGFESIKQLDTFHHSYCKQLLKLGRNTANCMVLGELGRHGLSKLVETRMINFWARVVNSKQFKLSSIVCNVLRMLFDANIYISPWLLKIKETLNRLGMSNIWENNCKVNKTWLKLKVKQRIDDIQYIHKICSHQ